MAEPRFSIERLTLHNFRNYESLRLEPRARLVALAGPNGAGKTNILEAISLLVPGRGLRGSAFNLLARLGGNGSWAVAADAETPLGDVQLGTGFESDPLSEDSEQSGRSAMIDGLLQKSSGRLGTHLRILWLTPAMDRLFAGPGGDRRRFFDRLVASFDESHGARVNAFEKLMRERNFLLQDERADRTWLSSLEAQMAECAIAMASARNEVARHLANHFAGAENAAPFPWGVFQLEGEIEELVAANPAVQAEEKYARMLLESRGLDRAQGRTMKGPHRTDFSVMHGPKSTPAALCSTGEQKALLIGLILAQARAVKDHLGAAPLLLLDEVAAHLDEARRHGLYETLTRMGAQSFMTGTEAALFAGSGPQAQLYAVENGKVEDMKVKP
jgi:DNA replication and repair protein RecF